MKQIIAFLKETFKSQKVIVACSTGVDSSVLLHLVMQALPKSQIIVAHVNHNKREQSLTEEAYLQDFCAQNGLKIYIKTLTNPPKANFQAWAREKRYQFFAETARLEQTPNLLLAHQNDDLLETIIMRLIRESNLGGYAGIQKHNTYHGLEIYRPLLDISKNDIYIYAQNNGIHYFEDASNQEDDYTRNRIRHDIIPLMVKENPSFAAALQHFQKTILGADELVSEKIKAFRDNDCDISEDVIMFSAEAFKKYSEFMQIQILFNLLKPYQLTYANIKELLKQIESPKMYIMNTTHPDFVMVKEYGQVIFAKPKVNLPFCQEILSDGEYNLPNGEKIICHKNICYFTDLTKKLCYNIPELPIYVRTFTSEDTLIIRNGHKSVSDYLNDRKVSHLKRQKIYVLAKAPTADASIIAVLGYRFGQRKEIKNG